MNRNLTAVLKGLDNSSCPEVSLKVNLPNSLNCLYKILHTPSFYKHLRLTWKLFLSSPEDDRLWSRVRLKSLVSPHHCLRVFSRVSIEVQISFPCTLFPPWCIVTPDKSSTTTFRSGFYLLILIPKDWLGDPFHLRFTWFINFRFPSTVNKLSSFLLIRGPGPTGTPRICPRSFVFGVLILHTWTYVITNT